MNRPPGKGGKEATRKYKRIREPRPPLKITRFVRRIARCRHASFAGFRNIVAEVADRRRLVIMEAVRAGSPVGRTYPSRTFF